MKQAFVYCRVSTEEQSSDDHYSLENQEKKARSYADSKDDWQIFKVKKDIASGKNDNRPGYQELLEVIKSKQIDVVIVYRLDRLSRNVRDTYDILELMEQNGIHFCSILESFDTTTAMGKAMLRIAAVFAQLTREMIAENVKDGLLRRAESGKSQGPGAYGYVYIIGDKLKPIPEQADVVKQIFHWFAIDKWYIKEIARVLNNKKVPTATETTQWRRDRVKDLLENPVYAGYIPAGDKLAKGIHEPLIDEDTWELAKERLASQKQEAPASQTSEYLLSGLLKCGKCNASLFAQKVNYNKKTGKSSYIAYRHEKNEFIGDRFCPGVYQRGDTLEEAIIEEIMGLGQNPDLDGMIQDEIQKGLKDDKKPLKDESTRIWAKLAEMGDRFDKWAERLDAGTIDEAQFVRRNTALMAEKKNLESRLSEIEGQLSAGETLEVNLRNIQRVLMDLPRAWNTLSVPEQKEILKLLIEKVTVYDGEINLYLRYMPVRPLIVKRSKKQKSRKQEESQAQ